MNKNETELRPYREQLSRDKNVLHPLMIMVPKGATNVAKLPSFYQTTTVAISNDTCYSLRSLYMERGRNYHPDNNLRVNQHYIKVVGDNP